jgi:hypothetical protein
VCYLYVFSKILHAKDTKARFFHWVKCWFQCRVALGKRWGRFWKKRFAFYKTRAILGDCKGQFLGVVGIGKVLIWRRV